MSVNPHTPILLRTDLGMFSGLSLSLSLSLRACDGIYYVYRLTAWDIIKRFSLKVSHLVWINVTTICLLLCILHHICCVWTANKITDIPQHRYRPYKEMNIFSIMCLKLLIVLTLRTFASNWFHNLIPIILININFLFVLQYFTFY